MDDWDIRPTEAPTGATPSPGPVSPRAEPAVLTSARRGVVVLRVLAVAALTAGILAQLLLVTGDDVFGPGVDVPFSTRLREFLRGVTWPLVYTALILATSLIVQVMIAKLELQHDAGEPSGAPAKPDARGDLVVKAPPRPLHHTVSGDDSIWRPRERTGDPR